MHRWLQLTLIVLLSTGLNFEALGQQSKQSTLKLYNSGSDYHTHLIQTGITDTELSTWSLPGAHVIVMGNVLDTSKDLQAQVAKLKIIEQLATANESKFSIVMGQTEYELSSKAGLDASVAEWLNNLPTMIQAGEHVISHRGLSFTAITDKADDIDLTIHHPANYMGSQICHPFFEADRLRQVLTKRSAKTLWVTQAQDFQVPWQKRLSNQLHILNQGVVATIINNRASVKLVDGTDVLFAEMSPNRYPENPVGMSDAEILEILRNGEVIGEEAIPVGITKPMKLTLSHNDKQIAAAFKNFDDAPRNERGRWKPRKRYADRYLHEVAAYKLDRKLGIGLVPITIERSVEGNKGSLQVWYDGLVSKLSYKEAGDDYKGHCDRKAQRNMMRVYDYLIMNDDRNQTNILHNTDDWQVWFIDHSRSFSDSINLTEQMRKSEDIYLTPEFRAILEATDRDQLDSLRPYLHKRRIQ
ncbi:MAG: hypothetical protein KJO69_01590, partial [Gammaproteobacteria bacterium]|nr:hypothetical protein [Gammaproteobacteria bacterium]